MTSNTVRRAKIPECSIMLQHTLQISACRHSGVPQATDWHDAGVAGRGTPMRCRVRAWACWIAWSADTTAWLTSPTPPPPLACSHVGVITAAWDTAANRGEGMSNCVFATSSRRLRQPGVPRLQTEQAQLPRQKRVVQVAVPAAAPGHVEPVRPTPDSHKTICCRIFQLVDCAWQPIAAQVAAMLKLRTMMDLHPGHRGA